MDAAATPPQLWRISENTVTTHSSRVFDTPCARRRTLAVQLGKEFRLIP